MPLKETATPPNMVWQELLAEPFHDRPCPVCDAGDERLLFVGDRHGLGLRNVICQICGHIYINPAPNEHWLDRFYVHVYRLLYNEAETPTTTYLERHDPMQLGIRDCMVWLAEQAQLKDGDSVLDIGCAEGTYLHEIGQLADVKQIGFEPAPPFADYARTRLPDATIHTAMFASEAIGEQHAHVAIAAHVLEHILDPISFLQAIKKALVPEGKVYIEVPVGDRQRVKNIFHIAHLNNFTRSSLPWLLHRGGFEVMAMDRKGTRGGAGGSYRVLARSCASRPVSDRLKQEATEVVRYQQQQFFRLRVRRLPRRIARLVIPRRPQPLL